MEPKNRLAEIFRDLGVKVRPTDETLEAWNMTYHRFNQLVQNNYRTPMTLAEAHVLQKWLQKNFKGKNAFLFEAEIPAEYRQAKLPLHQ